MHYASFSVVRHLLIIFLFTMSEWGPDLSGPFTPGSVIRNEADFYFSIDCTLKIIN